MQYLLAAFVVLVSFLSAQAQTGMRIKVTAHSQISGVPSSIEPTERTTTIYAQGTRIRTEWSMPRRSTQLGPIAITQLQLCDKHVIYTIDSSKHEYMESPMPSGDELEKAKKMAQVKQDDGPPNLVIEITTVDLGETKPAFGHTARHYVTTTKQTPSGELQQDRSETVEDAWYFVDVPNVTSCAAAQSGRPHGLMGGSISMIGDARSLQEIRPEFKYSGPEPKGLVLSSKRTTKSSHVLQSGDEQTTELTSSHEIIELSEVPPDAGLFQVPAGFTKVKQFSQ